MRSRQLESLLKHVAYPVDTGRQLNVYKTFRRRPGRLLNALCTVNSRPVSTGSCIKFSRLKESVNVADSCFLKSYENLLAVIYYQSP